MYGGVPLDTQTHRLRRKDVEVVVGTTGRILDHIERGNIDFTHMKTLVLDEADQMLKLGFKEDIDRVINCFIYIDFADSFNCEEIVQS